jgi:hypothetical protein
MHYLLTPLQTHFDMGFGGVANSFKHAADLVADPDSDSSNMNSHLPASFLYRHAIELFLKSGIIIFHRKFKLPWGTSDDAEPKVPVAGKWKPMYSIHMLAPLHARLSTLMHEHAQFLRKETSTNWEFPAELPNWIADIDATDSSSTFFRYPVTKHADKDETKSTMKAEDYRSIIARMGPEAPPQKMFVIFDEDDNVVDSYRMDRTQSLAMLQVLRQAAECMYNCHAAMRGELTGGW